VETGKFVTFEGIEGSGKSLQLALLEPELRRRGVRFLATREPGGTEFGAELRKILLHRDGPHREPIPELLLYLADRYQHLKERIQPALATGCHVFCDRYQHATLAYQGFARGLGFELIDRLAEVLDLPMPDLTLVLDVEVELALERARARNAGSEIWGRFEEEGLEFHRRVREGYRLLCVREPWRVLLVDASGSPEEIQRQIVKILSDHGILGLTRTERD
jgi:dTMP kinase